MTLDDVFVDLLVIVSEVGARPDLSTGADAFFEEMVGSFVGSKEEFLDHVRQNLRTWFRSVSGYPEWYQSEEWQYNRGVPMLYVGHLNVPASALGFQQDTRVFVFWDLETGETKTVIQSM
jgi:hypothetical protein